MGIHVAVHALGEVLFKGEADLEPVDETGWSLEFRVPAARVAQFQMRKGERVHIALPGDPAHRPALVEGCRLEDAAGFSGFSGSGVVLLAGEGLRPL